MCGIVGYTGFQNAVNIVVEGLKTLEYRGYDSAGVALGGDRLSVIKTAGRVSALEGMLPSGHFCSGIGHTRWATHGAPNALNAHPHLSYDGKIAVVHNGVLENCESLGAELSQKGIVCASETDSELIAHLLALEGGDMLSAVRRVGERLAGAATFLAMRAGDSAVYVYRQGASMLVAKGDGESFAASDGLALSRRIKRAVPLEDGDYAKLDRGEVAIFHDGRKVERDSVELRQLPPEDSPCHMRAEIDEIPAALKRTFDSISATLVPELADRIKNAKRIMLAGCGTAFNACRYGKIVAERMLSVPVEAIAASESTPSAHSSEGTVAIFISQSGETADTLLALGGMKQRGAYTLAITNVAGSGISRAAHATLLLEAGAEVAVAATKSYNCQLLALNMLFGYAAGQPLGEDDLEKLIAASRRANALDDIYDERAAAYKLFLVGKGQDLITAKEGALKLKEITYKQAEAYAAGELKHGPIALIDSRSLVIAIATEEEFLPRIRAAVSELRSRGAYTVGLSSVGDLGADKSLELPRLDRRDLEPLVAMIPLQNLALATSLCLGIDPDKPRNLAKSVTVI